MRELAGRGLVVAEHFVQGHGGTPESVLLLGRLLRGRGILLDIAAREGFQADLGALTALPADPSALAPLRNLALERYSFVFFTGSWNPLFPRYFWQARRAGRRTVYAAKGNLCRADFRRLRDLKKAAYLLLVEGPLLRLCDAVIYSSELERRTSLVPAWFRPTEAHVMAEPFIAAPLDAAPSPRPHGGPLTFGFLAEIAPRKGLLELAQGFRQWLERRPDMPARLVIAGAPRPGSEAYAATCRSLLAPFEARGLVSWVGAKRGAERDAFYEASDVFVMPSRFESFGLTPLEALWHGRPVIAAPQMGVMEYLAASAAVERLPDLAADSIAAALEAVSRRFEVMRAAAWSSRGQPLPGFYDDGLADRFLAGLLPRAGDADRRSLPADRLASAGKAPQP
jgi:glycosyltransferase involved in cell wall biosynthesis